VGGKLNHRHFLIGIIVGFGLAGTTYTGSGHANDFADQRVTVLPGQTNTNCQIRLGKRRLTNMPHCLEGEVVTGIMTTTYYCSKLILECPE